MFIQNHELWHLFHEKVETQNRNSSVAFETEVEKICQYGIELSKTIRDSFQTYTLHDETHINNVMTNMLMLLGDLKNRLSRDECAMLVMSACCHDIGMSVTQEEKEYLRSGPDSIRRYLNSNNEDYIIAYAGADIGKINITDEIIQHYVRFCHHQRVRDKLQEYIIRHGNSWPSALGNSISMHDLCLICQSHGESADGIKELQSFSTNLDLRLCAILLRLGDILDFDTTRAPDVLYQYIHLSQMGGIESQKSRGEWEKHQQSRGFTLSQDAHMMPILLYKADCTNIQTEHAILNYLDWVDKELDSCLDIIPYTESQWKDLRLPTKIKRSITVNGYLSGEYKFILEQKQVLELLVGKNIYEEPAIFVRELLQNAIDAIRTRKQLDKNLPPKWSPQINIRTWMEPDGGYWFCIEDNGMGMTEEMLRECFLKVGCSYYRSSQFQVDKLRSQRGSDYQPISRFGIGILSCFIGDPNNSIELTTRRFQEYDAPNPAYRLSMRGTSGYYHLSNSFDHQVTTPKMPNSSISFIANPGTMIAVKTNVLQSGGHWSVREIIEQHVVYPEVSIHYEAEENNYVHDYLSEDELLEQLHGFLLKTENGTYRPIERRKISDKCLQEIQECYPEIEWDEKPTIDFYILPLDYFSHSSMIKGVTMIGKASGKAIWRAEGLDEKYIPTIELHLAPVIDSSFYKEPRLIISPQMPNEYREDLKQRIMPCIESWLKQSGIDIHSSCHAFAEVLPSISLGTDHRIPRVTDEEFRVFQQTMTCSSFFLRNEDLEIWDRNEHLEDLNPYASWFKQYFQSRHIEDEGNLSISAHNGIFVDDSQLLVFGNAIISNTICILKDRYCPDLNLARTRIRNLPLEVICHLDAITDRIMDCIEVYDGRYTDSKCKYCYRDASENASLEEYKEIFEHTPELLSQLHFLTEFGVKTIARLKDDLDKHEEIFIYMQQIRPIHMAALMLNFNLKVSSFALNHKRRIFVTKKADIAARNNYLDFPPALFLPSTEECGSYLSGCYNRNFNSEKPYNSTHPFSVWLIGNHKVLQTQVPSVYTQIMVRLIYGFNIIPRINESLERLRKIPNLEIEVFKNLTYDDFFPVFSEYEY